EQRVPRTIGLLYRRIVDAAFDADPAIAACAATKDDIPALIDLSDDFFESDAEIIDYLASGDILLYRSAGGEVLGAGVMKRAIAGRSDVD
ncbi:hypothetical protein ABTL60_19455, partial [Acinetobacter baumannii]